MQKLFFIITFCFIAHFAGAQTAKDTIVLHNNTVVAGQIVNFQADTLYMVNNRVLEKYAVSSIRNVVINADNPMKDAIEKALLNSAYRNNSKSVMIKESAGALNKHTAGFYLKQSSSLFIGAGVVGFLGGIIAAIMLSGDGAGAAPYVLGITGAGAFGLGVGGIISLSNAGNALNQGNVGQYQYAK